MTSIPRGATRVGILWRGDPVEPAPSPGSTRLRRIFEEFAVRGIDAEPIVYADDIAETVRDRLRDLDGVLVWVDPIDDGRDRSVLDAALRDVAAQGVFVSAHPDVILQMGTKDVLYRTRNLPWGTDTHLYLTADDLAAQLTPALRSGEQRVLKQHRGNGGNGVWKLELGTMPRLRWIYRCASNMRCVAREWRNCASAISSSSVARTSPAPDA